MNVGVFSCDPGGATGLAWGIFDWAAPGGIKQAMETRMNFGSTTVAGDERTQIIEIAQLWQAFYESCVRSAALPPGNVYPVFENFVVRPGQTGGGQDMSISTSLIWGFEAYRMGRRDEWKRHRRGPAHMPALRLQLASQATTYATNPRLKDWGAWIVGREHERSAMRHICLFLRDYRDKKLGK